jgi:hypothetical protein
VKGATPRRKSAREPRFWYVLIHQLPPRPLYLRAKVRQRLAGVGAVALKNSVYALPHREECLEDLQWIGQEAVAGGGEAHVAAAQFLDPHTEKALLERFRTDRGAEYSFLAESIRQRMGRSNRSAEARSTRDALPSFLASSRRRFEEIARNDFFDAPGRGAVERLLAQLDKRARTAASRTPARPARELHGRTWATRRGVAVDRIATAWLIRRFIDPKARFRFVDPKEPTRRGELRFDIPGGDFSHEGDACTLETLIARSGIDEPALRPVAEIVHDIDLKDGKFGRPEARGVEQLLTGLLLANPSDKERLDRGFELFDQLYGSFGGKRSRKEARK